MAGYKGVGVVFVRRLVRDAGVEAQFLEALSDAERRAYETATGSAWVPMEYASKFFDVAAPLVFPGSPNPIRELGRALARDNLRGVYRFLVRALTVSFVLRQTATLWHTYHQGGTTRLERRGPKGVDLWVDGYPDLPERFRECMAGWIVQIAVMCGVKNARVIQSEQDGAFVWRATWR